MPQFIYVLIGILILANFISCILVYVDKQKSIGNTERVPEISFFIWSVFFASLGVLAGMYLFRHKTRKLSFVFGIGLLFLEQLALVYLFFQNRDLI